LPDPCEEAIMNEQNIRHEIEGLKKQFQAPHRDVGRSSSNAGCK
jgi:hypothetical protein